MSFNNFNQLDILYLNPKCKLSYQNPSLIKIHIYSSPTTLYQEFANAYAYNKMSITCKPRPNKQTMVNEINAEWKKIKSEKNRRFN